jgi:hypothetical protein
MGVSGRARRFAAAAAARRDHSHRASWRRITRSSFPQASLVQCPSVRANGGHVRGPWTKVHA